MNTKQTIIIAVVTAALMMVSFALPSLLDNDAQVQGAETNTINVSGECNISVPADVGYIQLGVETQDPDVKKAQSENAASMENIIEAVKDLGLSDDDITTSNYSIYPNYDYLDGSREKVPSYYVVSNTIKLKVKDLDLLSDVIDIATEAGANRAYNIYFDAEDTDEAKSDALSNAVADALAKADVIAQAADIKVVGIKTISDQTYYSSGYYDYAVEDSLKRADSASSSTPIMSGDVEVTANVSIEVIINN